MNLLKFEAMMGRLFTVRKLLAEAKNEKLLKKWSTHGDYRQHGGDFLKERLAQEILELDIAFESGDIAKIRAEVVDVANMLDFIWDVLGLWGV